jgi:hypothetical protein
MSDNTITYKNGHRFTGALHDFDNCEECKRPVISRARYAKSMYAVMCHSDSSGFVTLEEMRAAATRCRYSNREKAWIMSKAQVKRFIESIKPLVPIYYQASYLTSELKTLDEIE